MAAEKSVMMDAGTTDGQSATGALLNGELQRRYVVLVTRQRNRAVQLLATWTTRRPGLAPSAGPNDRAARPRSSGTAAACPPRRPAWRGSRPSMPVDILALASLPTAARI